MMCGVHALFVEPRRWSSDARWWSRRWVELKNSTQATDYHQRCFELLQLPTYVPLPRDPTPRVERRVMVTNVLKNLKKKAIDSSLFDKLKPTLKLSEAPSLYGLQKFHKNDTLLRLNVLAIGSPEPSLPS